MYQAGNLVKRLGRPPKHAARNTRAALLEAAISLFAQHGFSGTSIRAITRAAGTSESLLYRHFANKRAIFNAARGEVERGTAAQRPDVFRADDAGPRSVLLRGVERMLTACDAPQARRLSGMLACELDDDTPARLASALAPVKDVRALFARWMREGRMRTDLGTPEQLVWELFTAIAHVRLLYLRPDASPRTRQAGRDLALRHARFFAAAVFDVGPRRAGT